MSRAWLLRYSPHETETISVDFTELQVQIEHNFELNERDLIYLWDLSNRTIIGFGIIVETLTTLMNKKKSQFKYYAHIFYGPNHIPISELITDPVLRDVFSADYAGQMAISIDQQITQAFDRHIEERGLMTFDEWGNRFLP
jgi:hypothetical protein